MFRLNKFPTLLMLLSMVTQVSAHHVLGRPSYSLNEDSNTPPSMQVETQIGNYFINYMVFPAFPKAGESGRINLYVSRIDDGEPFKGRVTFTVKGNRWFDDAIETLGTQESDENVFRQGFVFKDDGSYIIAADFTVDGVPYSIEFPLRVGNTGGIGPLGLAVGLVLVVLIAVSILKRKKTERAKIRHAHDGTRP